jgi:tetratricopeptide (TPR) repeat protein
LRRAPNSEDRTMNPSPRSLNGWLCALTLAVLSHALPGGFADTLAQTGPGKSEGPPAGAGAADAALALKSMETLVAGGGLTPAERLKMLEAIVSAHYKNQNFTKAGEWGVRYVKDGGTDPQTRALATRALYQMDEFAGAASILRADIEADEGAGRAPAQERVQMLASCYVKLNDNAGYVYALEKMLLYYPKRDYWADAIRRAESTPGFSERLTLDLGRLMQATGNLTTAAQYTVMMQLALKAGLPAEAKKLADEGFASGVLGSGADASQHRKLQEMATKQVTEDDKTLAQSIKEAGSAKDGTALVNVGFTLVSAGQFDKGIAMMEQGLQKGGLGRPDDARLHLGIAYLRAGQKAKAVEMFKSVQGADGTAALARLWAIHAQRPAG